ncbi:hypothetical protein [Fictibacillus gelatini]|uniref:hypothetical protein n=1 Tax=Fictibacillus gelatini TaxID=225985 RepID=UPI0003FF8433|nr:hypothetical protein [Fictibacillus gelatini]
MKCIKCGVQFHPTDILVMDDDEPPICDSCESEKDFFIITHDNMEYIVQAEDSKEAFHKWIEWNERMNRKKFSYEERFSPTNYDIRRVEYVILNREIL